MYVSFRGWARCAPGAKPPGAAELYVVHNGEPTRFVPRSVVPGDSEGWFRGRGNLGTSPESRSSRPMGPHLAFPFRRLTTTGSTKKRRATGGCTYYDANGRKSILVASPAMSG